METGTHEKQGDNLASGKAVQAKDTPYLVLTGRSRLVNLVAQHQDGGIGHLLICQKTLEGDDVTASCVCHSDTHTH